MLSTETLAKIMRNLTERVDYYAQMSPDGIKACASRGNSKIGHALNFSLAPVLSCGNCSKCARICYDLKAVNQYHNVLDARARNWVLASLHPTEYFAQVRAELDKGRDEFMRWHVGGEIPNAEYFAEMIQIARDYPHVTFWTYTKMHGIVNDYVANHGGSRRRAIPRNFQIMFSDGWDDEPIPNPYNFPRFVFVKKGDRVPRGGFVCPGNCDLCKNPRRGCLAGKTTYGIEH